MDDELSFKPAGDRPPEDETAAQRAEQFRLAEKLLSEQNLAAGIAGGLVGAVGGAIAWGAITIATGTVYSPVAIGVGALAGWGVQVFGRGVTNAYGYIAMALAVVGCLLGVLAETVFAPRSAGVSIMDVIRSLTLEDVIAIYQYSLGLFDLVAWAVAAWMASILAKRRLSREEGLAIYMYELHGPG
jgi:hypothetical protein